RIALCAPTVTGSSAGSATTAPRPTARAATRRARRSRACRDPDVTRYFCAGGNRRLNVRERTLRQPKNPFGIPSILKSVAFGEGIFVAVGRETDVAEAALRTAQQLFREMGAPLHAERLAKALG